MGKKLYVGNLRPDVDDAKLQEWFSAFGTVVSANVVKDRMTGEGRGFGFVEMESSEEAEAAKTGLDGQERAEQQRVEPVGGVFPIEGESITAHHVAGDREVVERVVLDHVGGDQHSGLGECEREPRCKRERDSQTDGPAAGR